MYNHILIPVAPDHSGSAGKALEIARALLAEKGKITALTIIEDIPAYVASQIPDSQLDKTRSEIAEQLNADLGNEDGVTTRVIMGHSANTILEEATDLGADCIIISSHRPGLADYFLGSTAARVVRHAQCAVHVIR